MRKIANGVLSLALAAMVATSASPAFAQYGMDKKKPATAATPEMPRCEKPLGVIAVREPEKQWWTELGLSSPEVLIKLFAQRSGCFRVVDRNAGLDMRTQERDLAGSGDLQRGSNIGRGQVVAADFFLVPDIANSNSNSGGNAIGAIAGSVIPGGFGALAGQLRTKKSEAQVIITVVDARTTEQLYVAEGTAKKTDIGFGVGGGALGSTGFGAAAGGGYSNTEIGKVITAAYFNAFIELIHYAQSGAMPTGQQASADAGQAAVVATQSMPMRSGPSPTATMVLNVPSGAILYPTGGRNGVWMEVDDEHGNRGWVSSAFVTAR
ncbi:MAG: peptidoglycan-binding protein [Caulobacterales bacterium]|nr:peptidoglycan-binding protein [Caulobacterales bacterium]